MRITSPHTHITMFGLVLATLLTSPALGQFAFVTSPTETSTDITTYSWNPTTGAFTSLPNDPAVAVTDLVVHPSGSRYSSGGGAFTINSTMGALTAIAGSAVPSCSPALAIDSTRKIRLLPYSDRRKLQWFVLHGSRGLHHQPDYRCAHTDGRTAGPGVYHRI